MSESALLADLRASYDANAATRDAMSREAWKINARAAFLDMIQTAGRGSLLELGAGPGHDAAFFQAKGLRVSAVDYSPAMIARCREKGIDAYVADMAALPFADGCFEAAFAMNSLLHLPHDRFREALTDLGRVLAPQSLFFLGQYGGMEHQQVWEADSQRPPRFFAFFRDVDLLAEINRIFDVLQFRKIYLPHMHNPHGMRFQLVIARKRA